MENRNPMEGGDSIMLPLNMAQASEVQKDDVKEAEGDGARNVTSLFQRSSGRRAAFRGEDTASEALREVFSKWLKKQADDITELYDVAIVTYPAYSGTSADARSSMEHETSRAEWESPAAFPVTGLCAVLP